MHTINPALMNSDDRRSEIAKILALGILRLSQKKIVCQQLKKDSNSLDFTVFPSIHVQGKDDNQTKG